MVSHKQTKREPKFITELTDFAFLIASHSDVVTANTQEMLESLNRINSTRETALHFRGAVDIAIDGYNDDNRELFEVPEVRGYYKLLTEQFPYFFFYLNLNRPTLKVVAFCLSDAQFVGNGRVEINKLKWANFMQNQFNGLNALFRKYELDKDYPNLNREISEEVDRYFEE